MSKLEFKYGFESRTTNGVEVVHTALRTQSGIICARFNAHLNASNCGIIELHHLNVYQRGDYTRDAIFTELLRHMCEVGIHAYPSHTGVECSSQNVVVVIYNENDNEGYSTPKFVEFCKDKIDIMAMPNAMYNSNSEMYISTAWLFVGDCEDLDEDDIDAMEQSGLAIKVAG